MDQMTVVNPRAKRAVLQIDSHGQVTDVADTDALTDAELQELTKENNDDSEH